MLPERRSLRAITTVLAGLGTLALGSLLTLLVQSLLYRTDATQTARRELYFEMLTLLKTAARVQEPAILDHDSPIPDVAAPERIDAFDARLAIDASPRVEKLARPCFKLVRRFNASHVTGTPVELDEFGPYRYRFDLVRDVDEETAHLHRPLALGGIHDELRQAITKLEERMRREVHGFWAT